MMSASATQSGHNNVPIIPTFSYHVDMLYDPYQKGVGVTRRFSTIKLKSARQFSKVNGPTYQRAGIVLQIRNSSRNSSYDAVHDKDNATTDNLSVSTQVSCRRHFLH